MKKDQTLQVINEDAAEYMAVKIPTLFSIYA